MPILYIDKDGKLNVKLDRRLCWCSSACDVISIEEDHKHFQLESHDFCIEFRTNKLFDYHFCNLSHETSCTHVFMTKAEIKKARKEFKKIVTKFALEGK